MKKYIICACLGLCLLVAGAPAQAQHSEARIALESTINQVLAELEKPQLHDPEARVQVLERVEAIIVKLFNFDELSQRTVGQNWHSFSQDQRHRFSEAFKDLLRARYTNAFEGYNGGKVSYVKEAPLGSSGDQLQINTTVILPDKSVPVNYRMILKDRWYVYDVIIEGVSMVQNYRSQFQSVLRKNDPEELIRLVQQKALQTQNTQK